jgi:tetratricopeptide (TPR) repeat protein
LQQLADTLAEAAQLPPIPQLHVEVQHTTALALEAMGRFEDAIATLQPLLDAIDPIVPPAAHREHSEQSSPRTGRPGWPGWAQWATLHIALARCHRRNNDHALAARSAGPAFTIAALAADGGDVEAAEAAVQIGAVLVEVFTDSGEVLLARQTCTRLLQMAHDSGHPHARLQAYQQAVLVAETLGDLEEAAQWAERALHLLEADETFRNATKWHARYAALLLRVRPDQAERARDLLAQQLTHAALTGTTPRTLTALAEAELLLQRPDQAAAHARQALHTPGTGETGDKTDAGAQVPGWVRARALAVLASACDRLGDRDEAIAALVRRAEILEHHGPRRQAAQAWLQAADLLAPPHPAGRDHDEVEARRLRYYQRALAAMGLKPHV